MPIRHVLGSDQQVQEVVLDWIGLKHLLRLIQSILLDGDGVNGPRNAAVGGSHSAGLKK